jgi:hypothetical protein
MFTFPRIVDEVAVLLVGFGSPACADLRLRPTTA